MATDTRSQVVSDVIARAGVAVYSTRLALGLLSWAIVTGATWLSLFWLDNLLRLPGALRFPLAIAGTIVTVVSFWKNVVQRLRDRKTPTQIAALLERQYGIDDNVLINSLEFGRTEYDDRQRPFIEETLGQGQMGLKSVLLRELWQPARLAKWGVGLAVLLGIWASYTSSAPRYARNAFARYLYALSDVPPVGDVELAVEPGSDVHMAERDDLKITVTVSGLEEGARLPSYPEIYWKEGATTVEFPPAGASRIVMQPMVGQPNVYTHTFTSMRRDFAFRAVVKDTYSRSTQVSVLPAPRIAEGRFHLAPPAYTGGKMVTSMGPPHPVAALPGSNLQVEIKLDQPADSLRLKLGGEVIAFRQFDGLWRAETIIKAAGPYDIDVEAPGLIRAVNISTGVVSLLADRPPQVEFVQSAMSFTVLPGERVPLRLRAEDDHGLKDMKVSVRSAYEQIAPTVVKTWNFGAAPGKKGHIDETMDLSIDASIFAPGGKYFVESTATDFCPANSPTVSRPVLIEVKSLDKLVMPTNPKLADIYAALDRAIAAQKRALDASRTLTSSIDEVWLNLSGRPREKEEVAKLQDAHRNQILGNQRDVRASLLGKFPVITGPEKRILNRMIQLGEAEATQANDRAFALTQPTLVTSTKPLPNEFTPAAAAEPQKLFFSPTKTRYVGLVVRSTHGWTDFMQMQNTTVGGADAAAKWNVIYSRDASKALGAFADTKRWDPIGRLPFALVFDLGSQRPVDSLSLTPIAFNGSFGPKDVQVYLAPDSAPQFETQEQTKKQLAHELRVLERVQEAIYNELVALKGQESRKAEKDIAAQAKKVLGETVESAPSVKENVKKFLEELKDWTKEVEKSTAKRKSITDKPAQDFSEKDLEELAQTNLDKRKLARKLEDMVDELSNAAAMDFADSRMAKTLPNLLDKANDLKDLANLAAYKSEMFDYSYNLDNAMISQAKEITKGTEDTTFVDPTPGSGEAPEDKKAPVYLQEIPTELAVTVPPLKQKLDDYYEKIKQAGLSLANSVEDSDGPIAPSTFSGTSAAGKMGDAMPDQKMDRTGRSNVGRAGKSDGQMVGNTAPPVPNDKAQMQERSSNSPQEKGKVDDKSGSEATSQGLGKGTNGLTEFGKTGKLPPGMEKNLKQIQRQSEELRSSAHELVLKLQRHNLPSTDLKMAINRLEQMNQALANGNGVGIRQAYSAALKSLQAAQKSLAENLERRQIERAQNSQRQGDQAGTDIDADPRGYEDIIGAYFRQLAEKK